MKDRLGKEIKDGDIVYDLIEKQNLLVEEKDGVFYVRYGETTKRVLEPNDIEITGLRSKHCYRLEVYNHVK